MYIYHVLIKALRAHTTHINLNMMFMTHINLNMMFYTHVEHSPTKTTHTKHHIWKGTTPYTHKKHTHTKTHTMNSNMYGTDLYHTLDMRACVSLVLIMK